MGRNLIETIMGAVVLLVAVFFLVFAYRQADLGAVKGYPVTAAFASVGGLANGGDVRINGIKVGTVTGQRIDPNTFNAVVDMSLEPSIHLPVDTVASVDSEGLLGGKFVKLQPGHSGQTIPAGGAIANTKTYQSLEEMVGQIIFLATDSGAAKQGVGAGQGGAAAPAAPSDSPQGAGEQADMVLDFGFLKDEMLAVIDAPCDHGFLAYVKDEALLAMFCPEGRDFAGWLAELRAAVGRDGFHLTSDTRMATKLYVLDANPTAEQLSRHWFHRLAPVVAAKSGGLARLDEVTVWETPNCRASYRRP